MQLSSLVVYNQTNWIYKHLSVSETHLPVIFDCRHYALSCLRFLIKSCLYVAHLPYDVWKETSVDTFIGKHIDLFWI